MFLPEQHLVSSGQHQPIVLHLDLVLTQNPCFIWAWVNQPSHRPSDSGSVKTGETRSDTNQKRRVITIGQESSDRQLSGHMTHHLTFTLKVQETSVWQVRTHQCCCYCYEDNSEVSTLTTNQRAAFSVVLWFWCYKILKCASQIKNKSVW